MATTRKRRRITERAPARRSRPTTVRVYESLPEGVTVDAEAGTIKGAKFLGLESKKGYRYNPRGVHEAVNKGFYNRVRIYEDHPHPTDPNRKVRELIAVGVDSEYRGDVRKPVWEADGAYGTIKVLKEREGGRALLEAAQDKDLATVLGFSHNIDPTRWSEDGKMVEGIKRVYSVDLVDTPATTNGIFEKDDAMSKRNGKRRGIDNLTESVSVLDVFKECFPIGYKRVTRLIEDIVPDAGAVVMDAPGDDAAPEEKAAMGFKEIARSILDMDIDEADMKARLSALIDVRAEILDGAAGEEDSAGDGDGSDTGGGMDGKECKRRKRSGKTQERDDKRKPLRGGPDDDDDDDDDDASRRTDRGRKNIRESRDSRDRDRREDDAKTPFRQVYGWAKKYGVEDRSSVIEAACQLPPRDALRLIEDVGRAGLNRDDDDADSFDSRHRRSGATSRPRSAGKSAKGIEEDYGDWLARVNEGKPRRDKDGKQIKESTRGLFRGGRSLGEYADRAIK